MFYTKKKKEEIFNRVDKTRADLENELETVKGLINSLKTFSEATKVGLEKQREDDNTDINTVFKHLNDKIDDYEAQLGIQLSDIAVYFEEQAVKMDSESERLSLLISLINQSRSFEELKTKMQFKMNG